jgi:hypothetical protein
MSTSWDGTRLRASNKRRTADAVSTGSAPRHELVRPELDRLFAERWGTATLARRIRIRRSGRLGVRWSLGLRPRAVVHCDRPAGWAADECVHRKALVRRSDALATLSSPLRWRDAGRQDGKSDCRTPAADHSRLGDARRPSSALPALAFMRLHRRGARTGRDESDSGRVFSVSTTARATGGAQCCLCTNLRRFVPLASVAGFV